MAHYRIYRLNAAGRVTGAGFDAVCPNDQRARALAKRLLKAEISSEMRDGARDGAEAPASAAVVVEVNGRRASGRYQAAQAPTWGHADLFRSDVVADPIGERA